MALYAEYTSLGYSLLAILVSFKAFKSENSILLHHDMFFLITASLNALFTYNSDINSYGLVKP